MKTSQELLSSILKTTQMGQVGISQIDETAVARLQELDSAVRFLSNMTVRMRLTGADATSKISEMMIQGNTRGLVKCLRGRHHCEGKDNRVDTLTQKLIDTQTNNIRQMRPFL